MHALASLKPTHPIKEAMNAIEEKISDVEKYLALADNEGILVLIRHQRSCSWWQLINCYQRHK